MDYARYLPGQGLLLLFGTAIPDIALDDGQGFPISARVLLSMMLSLEKERLPVQVRSSALGHLC